MQTIHMEVTRDIGVLVIRSKCRVGITLAAHKHAEAMEACSWSASSCLRTQERERERENKAMNILLKEKHTLD